ncbi:MAG: glycosyltransferase, partial [Alphaproteobacteria bacterium]|nr:glycosyltransferase [Alphaproteobacteria bacterium]
SVLIKESRWKGVLCRLIYRYLYALADDVLCPSRRVRDELNLVAPGLNNLRLFCNPVDVSKLDQKTVKEAHAFYARTDRSVIRFLCVGRLDHEKGFDRVIQALGQVTLPYRWRLDIIGKGRERKHLERLIEKYNLKGKVFLRGYHASPWPMMKQADILLLPSRSEGMPNVALEALACGLPVLAVADAGGITEIDQLPDPAAIEIATDMAGMMARLRARSFSAARATDHPSLLPPQFQLERAVMELGRWISP